MAQLATEMDNVTLVNDVIDGFFERSIVQATHIDPSYCQLWENLYSLIRAGGKRLRPQMTLLAYEAFGGKDISAVVPVAAAQELLHFCLLIHDDIIDRDYVRHGTANIAGSYKISYEPFVSDNTERTHYANSAALLGGDLMLSGAYQLIASSTLDDEDKLIAQAHLAHSIFEVAGGELLDTESSFVPYAFGNALRIARYKTASYSFVAPLLTGAALAGIDDERMQALRALAHSLGVAYQLVDDILGVFGVEKEIGKSTSSDIREGKRTYLAEQATAAMTDQQKRQFERTFGNPTASLEAMADIRELFVSTGARQKTEETIARYAHEARETLLLLALESKYHDEFEHLISKVTKRSF